MNNYKVQFVNFDLGRGAIIGHVCGISGKSYLMSRYRNGRHEAEPVSLERYAEIIRDVSGAWHLPMRRWIPLFVKVGDGTDRTHETNGTYVAGEETGSHTSHVSHMSHETEAPADLAKLPVSELRKLAATKRRERKLDLDTRNLKRTELLAFLKTP